MPADLYRGGGKRNAVDLFWRPIRHVLHGSAERGLCERPLPVDVDGLDDDLVLAVLAKAGQHETGALRAVIKLVHVEKAVVLRAANINSV